ncbi:hypothetical protein [Heliophilum fasciatum]|uniref:Uncharacterized protein n=1 Tax=Heliophilum fasciatum TaxID=35700 RepID=A0A4R2RZI5_9FIRM|nr:hypothetical protein [Heliophilum fasciatum]MCW2277915.1 type II secretory pathway pseudopilin PulG [Heliophilum fasciatum]TCP64515.1 hypothetical protein EDD73_10956 [Heliophilum fasciatum]
MTIRSVDMQVIVPKVTEISRTQQIQQQQGQNEQQFQSQLNQQTTQWKQQSVPTTGQADKGAIKDRESKQQQRKQHEQKSDEDKEQNKDVLDNEGLLRGHHLDLRI